MTGAGACGWAVTASDETRHIGKRLVLIGKKRLWNNGRWCLWMGGNSEETRHSSVRLVLIGGKKDYCGWAVTVRRLDRAA
jgi:hypothetical protein